MVTLVIESLFNKLFQALHVLFIDDLCQHTECICSHYFIITLLDVLAQTRDHNENFVLTNL
jgi:hypothetical protein